MKHKFVKLIFCTLLISALVLAPMSAMAASYPFVARVRSDNGECVHLREFTNYPHPDPSIDNVIGRHYNGDFVLVYDRIGQMYQVVDCSGKMGWMWTDCLPRYSKILPRNRIYAIRPGATVYNPSGRKMGTVKGFSNPERHVPVYVVGTDGDMVQVLNLKGRRGLVYASDLEKPSF